MTYRGEIKNSFGTKRYASVSLSLNALNYYGDLSPTQKKVSTDLSMTKLGLGLAYSLKFGPRFSGQVGFLCGSIYGSDVQSADRNDLSNGIYRYNRNLSFRNRIQELSVTLQIDFKKNDDFYRDRTRFVPYALLGIIIFHHNPQAKVPDHDLNGGLLPRGSQWIDLQPLGTEGQHAVLEPGDANYGNKPYKLIQPAVPVGIGVRIRLNDQLDISPEFSLRFLFTDYLDDVSKNYVDLGSFGNNELAKAMSYRSNEIVTPNYQYTSERDGETYTVLQGYGSEHKSNLRGSSSDKDFYTVFSFKASYIFEKYRSNKPKFR